MLLRSEFRKASAEFLHHLKHNEFDEAIGFLTLYKEMINDLTIDDMPILIWCLDEELHIVKSTVTDEMSDLDFVKILLDIECINVNNKKKSRRQMSALHLAVLRNDVHIIGQLLLKNANVNDVEIYNCSVLQYAVSMDSEVSTILKLIENGADVDHQNNFFDTALHTAAHAENVDIVKALVDNDADINLKDKYGDTAAVQYLQIMDESEISNDLKKIHDILQQTKESIITRSIQRTKDYNVSDIESDMDNILKGLAEPLDTKISDYVRRCEFQGRGCLHYHILSFLFPYLLHNTQSSDSTILLNFNTY